MPHATFYDCREPEPDEEGIVHIERIYCFDFDAFGKAEWAILRSAYESLPGWLGAPDVARWFGMVEGSSPYLWASVEPPGLQVAGCLSQRDWGAWDRAFQAATVSLPLRSIE